MGRKRRFPRGLQHQLSVTSGKHSVIQRRPKKQNHSKKQQLNRKHRQVVCCFANSVNMITSGTVQTLTGSTAESRWKTQATLQPKLATKKKGSENSYLGGNMICDTLYTDTSNIALSQIYICEKNPNKVNSLLSAVIYAKDDRIGGKHTRTHAHVHTHTYSAP